MSDKLEEVQFKAFPKLARWNRDIVVSEKIDGTNAAVGVLDVPEDPSPELLGAIAHDRAKLVRDPFGDPFRVVFAQSRKRHIHPEDDNFGFARFVHENADVLAHLDPGYHYGEWWGNGIQRGYGLENGDKRFSLFNPETKMEPSIREIIDTVPVIYEGPNLEDAIRNAAQQLREDGSWAAPGFNHPEGIVIYHVAARQSFKVTLENDGVPKSMVQ